MEELINNINESINIYKKTLYINRNQEELLIHLKMTTPSLFFFSGYIKVTIIHIHIEKQTYIYIFLILWAQHFSCRHLFHSHFLPYSSRIRWINVRVILVVAGSKNKKTQSDWLILKGGVPQGTKLGVILFTVMTNKLLSDQRHRKNTTMIIVLSK